MRRPSEMERLAEPLQSSENAPCQQPQPPPRAGTCRLSTPPERRCYQFRARPPGQQSCIGNSYVIRSSESPSCMMQPQEMDIPKREAAATGSMQWNHASQAIPRLAVGHPVRLLELGMTNPTESSGLLTRVRIFPCHTMLRRLLKSRVALFARPISVAASRADTGHLSNLVPMAWIRPNFHYYPRLLAHGYSRFGKHLFRLSSAVN